ncbi:MAG: helix-turn-helix domain-containing protein [Pseudoxanthomonas sp.]|jgi:DNA-binding HxlR family transcriptional regulator
MIPSHQADASRELAAPIVDAQDGCPMRDLVQLVSGKWAIPILYRLIVEDAPVRFGALQRAMAPITQKELTRQLRLFERRHLVQRTVHPEVPPRVEYEATALGHSLAPTLHSLADWMRAHGPALKAGMDDAAS